MKKGKIKFKKERSFTLIEILVAMAIFVLVIGTAIGIFVSSAKSQTRIKQLKGIEDNARYAMELMSREIRMAYEIAADEKISPSNSDSEIDFKDSLDFSIKLCRADSSGDCNPNGDYLARREVNEIPSSGHLVTSNKVRITELIFYINSFNLDDGPPARVTISMTVVAADNDSVKMNFQTTVSVRNF